LNYTLGHYPLLG